MPSQQPPPLPPRSPRPPATGHTPSHQHSAPGFPPPPQLPPRPSAVSSSSVGPPPPLPPRPSGYESSNPTTPLTSPPLTPYAPSSTNIQAGSHFPLPPPPPLGPPPPYTASVEDVSFSSHHPSHAELTGPTPGQSISTYPASGVASPTPWINFPPPPPGPPPQPSPHLSPGISEYSSAPSRPLSPAGAPAGLSPSQSPSVPSKQQDALRNSSQIHNNGSQAPNFTGEKLLTYQPPVSDSGMSPGPSNSPYSEKPSREGHGDLSPSLGAPLNQASSSSAQPISGVSSPIASPSTRYSPPLEASLEPLHLASVPPVPPKSPLAPSTNQNHPGGSATSTSGPLRAYSPSGYQAHIHPSYKPPSKAGSPTPNAQLQPAQSSSPPDAPDNSPHRAVTSCIDIPVTFPTDWYWHPEAPEYLICSRCCADHIRNTRYRTAFQRGRFNDSKPRTCRFSKPRMKDHLYKEALATGSLQPALAWMRKRSAVTDCKGVDGVRGKFAGGITWYATREIPAFLSCQACYEDRLMTNQFAQHFSVHGESQPANAVWSCDVPVPFIEREYEEKGKKNDWAGFVVEAKARITTQPCPGMKKVASYGRNWFVPRAGPQSLILCAACYYDQIIHSGKEDKWEVAQGLGRSREHTVRCARGVFNIRILMAQAQEKKDFGLFWRAIDGLSREKECDDAGIVDGVWYTLPSNARDFGVCGACYIAILEPLGVARFWVRKTDVRSGARLLCCFNIGHPRLFRFVPRLLEMYFTLDPKALDEYASVYAAIPLCPRDEDKADRRWYGWKDCTICPECYLDFARHSPLENMMELRDTTVAESRMCEMYSPRMRKLYTGCGDTSPPDPQPFLEYSVQRRRVYAETVPKIRVILAQQRMALQQQKFPNTMNALQGAGNAQQGMEVAPGIGTGDELMTVQQLEQRWRAVE
ncbi:hypothetical protein GGR55DRAFT_89080 [Xylaria sp. FL0064]|nr:hypothetical protein GGR55DRAFT_89080 [Xylaria sp. FL0064]